MYGFDERFDYFECAHCGCLQISTIPEDLKKYYPGNYYSLSPKVTKEVALAKQLFRKVKISSFLASPSHWEFLPSLLLGGKPFFQWVKAAGVGFDDAILDVGCGSGGLLINFKKYGFKNLTGLDPFIDGDIAYENGPLIIHNTLDQLQGQFDFIMAHHSFEHMPQPEVALAHIHRLLKPGKSALIRIPIASSQAWKQFGPDWVQLDAPRHLYLHSVESMAILANKTGFEIENVFYDSTEFQFWGSLQYQKGIPLMDPRSYSVDRKKSLFSNADIKRFKVEARRLNREKSGDSAGFLLRRLG